MSPSGAVGLGAGVEPDGRMSDMLADRVEVAIALYRRGAGRKLLLSGDGRPGYDEPAAMRRAVRMTCTSPICGCWISSPA